MQLLTPDLGLIFWMVVVFLTVLFILKKFAWKPILSALEERENFIEQALKQAEKAREEMAKLVADNEKILNLAKEERALILKEAKQTKDQIVNEAKEEAKAVKSKIVEEAKREIENQKMAALIDLKNQAGTMAIDMAEKIMKKELEDKKRQEAFVAGLMKEIKLN